MSMSLPLVLYLPPGITNCAANLMGVVAPAVAGYLTQVGRCAMVGQVCHSGPGVPW